MKEGMSKAFLRERGMVIGLLARKKTDKKLLSGMPLQALVTELNSQILINQKKNEHFFCFKGYLTLARLYSAVEPGMALKDLDENRDNLSRLVEIHTLIQEIEDRMENTDKLLKQAKVTYKACLAEKRELIRSIESIKQRKEKTPYLISLECDIDKAARDIEAYQATGSSQHFMVKRLQEEKREIEKILAEYSGNKENDESYKAPRYLEEARQALDKTKAGQKGWDEKYRIQCLEALRGVEVKIKANQGGERNANISRAYKI